MLSLFSLKSVGGEKEKEPNILFNEMFLQVEQL